MKPFTQDDINTTVKVVLPLSQYDADLHEVPCDRYVGQLARVSRVDLRNACGQLVSVMTDFGQVWLDASMLERGTLVQTWVPEAPVCTYCKHSLATDNKCHSVGCNCVCKDHEPDIDQQAEEAFRESCAKQFPIVHPESHYAKQQRPAFISGFKSGRT